MCANSVEHANLDNKNWLLGVNFINVENNKQVVFTMTDIGLGILKTLKRKLPTLIKESILNKKDTDILYDAFLKRYGSNTEDLNRNKGLPRIYNIFEKKYLNNLIIITNNVILDFNNGKSRSLNKSLNGTFYYWTIDINCIETWKKSH